MGNHTSILYENLKDDVKKQISDEFIKIYSRENVKDLLISHEWIERKKYVVYVNKLKVCFYDEANLVTFINQLNRPFIFQTDEHDTIIKCAFVYGLKPNSLS